MSRFIVHDCAQRSDAWRQVRAGRLTGSVAKDMLSEGRSGEAAGRRNLRYRLVAERLTGRPQEDGYTNAAMQWGIEHEAEAITAYESLTGHIVMPVGFVALNDALMGCSPDGVIDDWQGLVSIKCPLTANHIAYMRGGKVPSEYVGQCLAELYVTGAQWIDFMSYDPRLPEPLQTFLFRMKRDEQAVEDFARKARAFLAECEAEYQALRTLANPSAVLAEAARA